MDLKRSEVLVEIYKKQVDQMADLRCELTIAQEENQKLYSNMEVLQHEVEKTTMLEEMVSRVQHELRQTKKKSDEKDLKIQTLTFSMRDAEGRV